MVPLIKSGPPCINSTKHHFKQSAMPTRTANTESSNLLRTLIEQLIFFAQLDAKEDKVNQEKFGVSSGHYLASL